MDRDLRAFLRTLEADGELVRVAAEVDPVLELPEIHRRVIAAGGPALFFERLRGSPWRVASNLFGTTRRVETAFGRRPKELLERLVRLVERAPKLGVRDLPELMSLGGVALGIGMRRRATGPVTAVVEGEPRLSRVPFTKSWPDDGGGFLTLPLVYTEHPDGLGPNLGIYRVQRYDERTTGMHWQIGKGGGFHHAAAEARGQALPAVIHLGGPPSLILAAIAPLPENVPELLLASLLAGAPVPQVDSPVAGHPLPLLAEAELALIGSVPAGVRRPEGPFGDHYGYYSLTHDYPVFECRALARRRDPIVPHTVVGKPKQEDFFLGDYLQDLLSPIFPLVMPQVRDLWSYGDTGYHALSAAVVRERYEREALSAAFRILGEGQLSLTKFLILLDTPVDLKDFPAVLTALLERTDPATDLYAFDQTSMDSLDYAGPKVNRGSKGVWMGLGRPRRALPASPQGALPRGIDRLEVLVPGCAVVEASGYREDPDLPDRLAEAPGLAAFPLVVLTDRGAGAAESPERFLWVAFTRFNPATDLRSKGRGPGRPGAHTLPLVLDARMKPWYPPEVVADDATKAKVTARWAEYFPAGGVEAGDTRS